MSRSAFPPLAKQTLVVALACGAGMIFSTWTDEGEPPGHIGSRVVTWAEASPIVSGWGELRIDFRGETRISRKPPWQR